MEKNGAKVRAIINDQGQNINIAEPSTPVEILGINGASNAGDDFIVIKFRKRGKKFIRELELMNPKRD